MNRYSFKDSIKVKFIEHKSFIGKGMSELYNLKSVIGFILLLGIWLQQRNIMLPSWLYLTIGIVGTFGCWLLGKLWDKAHMYDVEAEFSNKRNPAIRKLLRRK